MVVTRAGRLERWLPAGIGVLIVLVIALLPASLPTGDDVNTLTTAPSNAGNPPASRLIGPIFSGVVVAQAFPATGTAIRAVAPLLTTYQRQNRGTLQVTIQALADGQWRTLGSRTLEKAALQDNAPATIAFDPPLPAVRGQLIQIVLQADGGEQDAIAWWAASYPPQSGFILGRNSDVQPDTAQFTLAYARASGHLAGMIGPLWARTTVFLGPLWRVVLAVGLAVLCGGFLLLGRYLPDSARETPSTLPADAPAAPADTAGAAIGDGDGLESAARDPAAQAVDR